MPTPDRTTYKTILSEASETINEAAGFLDDVVKYAGVYLETSAKDSTTNLPKTAEVSGNNFVINYPENGNYPLEIKLKVGKMYCDKDIVITINPVQSNN